MSPTRSSRRAFLAQSTAASLVPFCFNGQASTAAESKAAAPSDRPLVGCIGTGSRWGAVGRNAMRYGDCVAVCDVDGRHVRRGQQIVEKTQGRKPDAYDDYRRILDRKDVEIVTITTPDHWHTKIAIEALRAGKDVYCEKPLTLTIDEGKQICRAVKETGRVFQVGTQQRSEMGLRFLTAVALIRDGRIGKVKRVQCAIGGAPTSPSLPVVDPPAELNWERWLGQAPLVDYRADASGKHSRCHYEFRWWYEYSGGKMTDWGAHHVDIAHWALGMTDTGPVELAGTAKHPVPFKNGMPQDDTRYNTATAFMIKGRFANGIEIVIRHDTDNGILFEGEKGRFFVSRGRLSGRPVEELRDHPLPEDALKKAYNGRQPGDHMRNFFECVKAREQPISDVFSHHRALTTCHLANIAIRLGRPIRWDPQAEQIVGDDEANQWLSRPQRKGYETDV